MRPDRRDHPAVLRVIAISALLTGLAPGVARGAWHRPVPGPVLASFSFSPAAPYAAGQRRGIVLSARPGEPVRAACAGRVAFAGTVGRSGPTISVRCDALRATYQGIAAIGVEEGAAVRRGETIAQVGPEGALRLGARTGPNRYVDPATLLADPDPPLGPAPSGTRHRPAPAPPVLPRAVPRPRALPMPPTPAPILAWAGLAALLTALGPFALRLRRSGASSLRPACRTTSPRRSTT